MINFYFYYNIYIYIYKIVVNPKRYTHIDWYQNISFHWLNRYSIRYEINFLSFDTDYVSKLTQNPKKFHEHPQYH